ncbi:MAG: DUF3332 domain-containing protein [Marinifilaceae bacterium]
MKKTNIFLLACLMFVLSIGQTGCYGPFRLTKNLHEWNGTVGDKFINALVFFAFVVIPVYEVAVFIDGVVLNTIEFWTGDNPINMAANDKQVKIVKKDGKKYRITATQNKFHIEQLEGPNKGEFAELIFNPEEQTWSLKDGNKALQKLVNLNEETQTVTVYKPNGEYIQADLNETNLFTLRHQLNQQQRMYSMQ